MAKTSIKFPALREQEEKLKSISAKYLRYGYRLRDIRRAIGQRATLEAACGGMLREAVSALNTEGRIIARLDKSLEMILEHFHGEETGLSASYEEVRKKAKDVAGTGGGGTGTGGTITDDTITDDTITDDTITDDTGTNDTGTNDTSTDDAGTDDAGTDDAGTDDAGTDDTITGGTYTDMSDDEVKSSSISGNSASSEGYEDAGYGAAGAGTALGDAHGAADDPTGQTSADAPGIDSGALTDDAASSSGGGSGGSGSGPADAMGTDADIAGGDRDFDQVFAADGTVSDDAAGVSSTRSSQPPSAQGASTGAAGAAAAAATAVGAKLGSASSATPAVLASAASVLAGVGGNMFLQGITGKDKKNPLGLLLASLLGLSKDNPNGAVGGACKAVKKSVAGWGGPMGYDVAAKS